ncbi:MAG: hypothetical protein EZS28_040903 [Streblomastix strix]|uniref:Uncharacterized protein n=1 Tax=Streblomastix strix TaxID=222440 RepID=A0A5J4U0S0_9EUKA|nr:MAG: hypothetical protein EZS28_040903 [Streblomastix strix]
MIKLCSDASSFTELIKVGYVSALAMRLSTAGGIGDRQDIKIFHGLNNIFWFFYSLHRGRNNPLQQPLPLQPALCKTCKEQIVEEGAIEEIEAQLSNKQNEFSINKRATWIKGEQLNYYIDRSNAKPEWYQ